MKLINILSIIGLSLIGLYSCKKKEANLHNKGEITLQYDDSYVNVAEALAYRYQQVYPDTKINFKISKENQALEDLLNKKVDAIIMSRDLTEQEKKYWEINLKKPINASYFAADAVLFVVNKNNPKEFITLEEIKDLLLSNERKLIFEGANTSNFNAVSQKINLSPTQMNFYQVEGNENIIKALDKYPYHIGVISYNTISRPNGEKAQALRDNIKILPVKIGNNIIEANKTTLKSQEYPFTKLLYFLTREEKFGLANGLIRYSCTSIGQKIVAKEGLQPFFLFPRTIKINTEN